MRKWVISLAAALTALSVSGEVEWSATEYDFGVMREAAGPQTGFVRLVNKGESPTYISRVRPSCGCTGASYTEEVIMPGDTAKVSFTYNPAGRPGRFEKTVKVYMGDENALTTIYIKGTVIGEPASLERDYPVTAGALRMSTDRVDFGDVKQGSGRHSYIKLYNTSQEAITPVVTGGGEGVEVELATARIEPGDVGTFSVYLNTPAAPGPGSLEYDYTVCADGDGDDCVRLHVGANILADLSGADMRALLEGPQLVISPATVNVGKVKMGKVAKWSFEIDNVGASTLQVARVRGEGGSVKIKRLPSAVKAGKHSRVEGTLDTRGMSGGAFREYVEVVTDDPLHPVVKVAVTGIILE